LTDKNGRLVNERGYLWDKFGHIKHKYEPGWRLFSVKDLDEKGEIPLPFAINRYNFNPHEIIGSFDFDEQGNPKLLPLKQSPKGQGSKVSSSRNKTVFYADKNGKMVNKKGFLVNEKGAIIDL